MNKTKRITGILGLPYVFWAAAFIIIPLIMVVWYGLTDANGAFTLANVAAIAEPAHRKALLMALLLSFIATIVCLVLAYPLCMFLVETNKNSTSFLTMLLIVPMWMNFLLRTYAWQSLLEKTGIINTFLTSIGLQPLRMINTNGAIILGMVYNFLPFMILPIYTVLSKIDREVVMAARDLGAGPWQTFARITLPLSKPGVISGITMVFVPSLTTFVITDLLGGGKIQLIGNTIEQEFVQGSSWHVGSGLSIVLMIFVIASMALIAKYDPDSSGAVIGGQR